jgi:hypothetical protein
VDWSVVKAQHNYKFEWQKMMKPPLKSVGLQFIPIILPPQCGGYVIILDMRREGNDLQVFGGYHENAPRDTPSQDIHLKLNINIPQNNNLNQECPFVLQNEKTVTISYWRALLFTFCDLPWSTFSESIAPNVKLSVQQVLLSEYL